MLISVKYNFVLLSTPKSASNSIEALLQPYSDISLIGPPFFRHTNFSRYSKYIKPYLKETADADDLQTMCLIREPLSWLNSHYRFRSRWQIRNPNHRNFRHSTHGMQFSDYVEAYMLKDPPPYADVGCQFDFVKNDLNEIGVEKIFLYENMAEFIQYMSRKVGKSLKIGYKNSSPKKGNESNLVELTDYVARRIARAFNLKPTRNAKEVDYGITSDLANSLRKFMADDFALYERVKRSHKST